MAVHPDIPSMLNESLPEMLLVAKYCIEFRKDTNIWSAPGCYGYPAALILLSVVDSVGSYVELGNVRNHFNILKNKTYYNLGLDDKTIDKLYDYYRNTLSHHSVLVPNVSLRIGELEDRIIQEIDGLCILNLIPFYRLSVIVVNEFLNNPKILENNKTIEYIQNKNKVF